MDTDTTVRTTLPVREVGVTCTNRHTQSAATVQKVETVDDRTVYTLLYTDDGDRTSKWGNEEFEDHWICDAAANTHVTPTPDV